VTKHVSKCRPEVSLGDDGVSPEEVTAQLAGTWKKVLYYAAREKDARVSAAAGSTLLMLLAALSAAGGAAAVAAQEAAVATLTDALTKHKTRLQRPLVERLLLRCSEAVLGGDAAALSQLLKACAKPRNDFVQAEALQLLSTLFKLPPAQQSTLLLPAVKRQAPAVAAALTAGLLGPYKTTERHVGAVKAVRACCTAGVKAAGQGGRLADAFGPETVTGLAKAVVVLKVSVPWFHVHPVWGGGGAGSIGGGSKPRGCQEVTAGRWCVRCVQQCCEHQACTTKTCVTSKHCCQRCSRCPYYSGACCLPTY
jgi:hypothetical protein